MTEHSNIRNLQRKETKFKALMITVSFPPQIGGIQTALLKLCQRYSRLDVIVIAPSEKNAAEIDKAQSFPVYRIRPSRTSTIGKMIEKVLSTLLGGMLGNMFRFIVPTWLQLQRTTISIIQCGHIRTGLVGYLAKKLYKIPYVIHVHGKEVPNMANALHVFDRKLGYLAMQKADFIIAHNEYARLRAIDWGLSESKIKNVRYGVDFDIFSLVDSKDVESLRSQLTLRGRNIILTVGRLVEKKAQDAVIRALPQVINKVPSVMYLLIGDGPTKSKLESLIKALKLENHVYFLGVVPHQDIQKYYALCDVFAMPSRQVGEAVDLDVESFGIVFLEANACSKPVIGGCSGGMNESVVSGETGMLVDADNTDELASIIIKLLTDQELAKSLGKKGCERVKSKFDWTIIASEVENILDDLVRKDICV